MTDPTGIPIREILNEAIAEGREEKKEVKSWHISKLGSCLRGMYLERLGMKPDTEIDERTLRVFSVGNLMEAWVVGLLKDRQDIKIETQVRVEDKELDISGRVDLIAEYNGQKQVYEVKTKHSRAFWHMEKNGEGAMIQHQYQVWAYLHLLGIDEGNIWYISKDDLTMLEYPVKRNNKKLEQEVMEQIAFLNKAWKEKDASSLPLPADDSWQKKYCRWHKQCVMEK